MTTTTRTIIGKTTMNRMTWFTEITGDWDNSDDRDMFNKRDDWDEWGGCDEWND